MKIIQSNPQGVEPFSYSPNLENLQPSQDQNEQSAPIEMDLSEQASGSELALNDQSTPVEMDLSQESTPVEMNLNEESTPVEMDLSEPNIKASSMKPFVFSQYLFKNPDVVETKEIEEINDYANKSARLNKLARDLGKTDWSKLTEADFGFEVKGQKIPEKELLKELKANQITSAGTALYPTYAFSLKNEFDYESFKKKSSVKGRELFPATSAFVPDINYNEFSKSLESLSKIKKDLDKDLSLKEKSNFLKEISKTYNVENLTDDDLQRLYLNKLNYSKYEVYKTHGLVPKEEIKFEPLKELVASSAFLTTDSYGKRAMLQDFYAKSANQKIDLKKQGLPATFEEFQNTKPEYFTPAIDELVMKAMAKGVLSKKEPKKDYSKADPFTFIASGGNVPLARKATQAALSLFSKDIEITRVKDKIDDALEQIASGELEVPEQGFSKGMQRFFNVIKKRNPLKEGDSLPFLGSLLELSDLRILKKYVTDYKIKSQYQKLLKDGKVEETSKFLKENKGADGEIDQTTKELVETEGMLNSFNKKFQNDIYTTAGKAAIQMPSFIGSMGVGSAAGKATSVAIKNSSAVAKVMNAAVKAGYATEKFSEQSIKGLAAVMKQIAAVSTTGATSVPKDAYERLMDRNAFVFSNEAGEFFSDIQKSDETILGAAAKAYAQNAQEYFTEKLGTFVEDSKMIPGLKKMMANSDAANYLNKLFVADIVKKYKSFFPKGLTTQAWKDFAKSSNYNGLVMEQIEEFASNRISPLIEGQEDDLSLNKLLEETKTTALATLPFIGLQTGFALAEYGKDKARRFTYGDEAIDFENLQKSILTLDKEEFDNTDFSKTISTFKNQNVIENANKMIEERKEYEKNNTDGKTFFDFKVEQNNDNIAVRDLHRDIMDGKIANEEVGSKIEETEKGLNYKDNKYLAQIKEAKNYYELSGTQDTFANFFSKNESEKSSLINDVTSYLDGTSNNVTVKSMQEKLDSIFIVEEDRQALQDQIDFVTEVQQKEMEGIFMQKGKDFDVEAPEQIIFTGQESSFSIKQNEDGSYSSDIENISDQESLAAISETINGLSLDSRIKLIDAISKSNLSEMVKQSVYQEQIINATREIETFTVEALAELSPILSKIDKTDPFSKDIIKEFTDKLKRNVASDLMSMFSESEKSKLLNNLYRLQTSLGAENVLSLSPMINKVINFNVKKRKVENEENISESEKEQEDFEEDKKDKKSIFKTISDLVGSRKGVTKKQIEKTLQNPSVKKLMDELDAYMKLNPEFTEKHKEMILFALSKINPKFVSFNVVFNNKKAAVNSYYNAADRTITINTKDFKGEFLNAEKLVYEIAEEVLHSVHHNIVGSAAKMRMSQKDIADMFGVSEADISKANETITNYWNFFENTEEMAIIDSWYRILKNSLPNEEKSTLTREKIKSSAKRIQLFLKLGYEIEDAYYYGTQYHEFFARMYAEALVDSSKKELELSNNYKVKELFDNITRWITQKVSLPFVHALFDKGSKKDALNANVRRILGKDFYDQLLTSVEETAESKLPPVVTFNEDGTLSVSNIFGSHRAYHGTPHKVDRFSTEKIGTGEGEQAFGWGLYFTDLKSIANAYAKKLSGDTYSYDGKVISKEATDYLFVSDSSYGEKFNENTIKDIAKIAIKKINKEYIPDLIEIEKTSRSENQRKEIPNEITRLNGVVKELKEIIKSKEIKLVKNKKLYEVSLHKGKTPEQYTYLEWDKPLDKKLFSKIKNIFETQIDEHKKSENYNQSDKYIKEHYEDLLKKLNDVEIKYNKDLYKRLSVLFGSDKQASLFLLENGIDGIRYPAESIARGATSETARGFNYVIFDENAITIEEENFFSRRNNATNSSILENNDLLKSKTKQEFFSKIYGNVDVNNFSSNQTPRESRLPEDFSFQDMFMQDIPLEFFDLKNLEQFKEEYKYFLFNKYKNIEAKERVESFNNSASSISKKELEGLYNSVLNPADLTEKVHQFAIDNNLPFASIVEDLETLNSNYGVKLIDFYKIGSKENNKIVFFGIFDRFNDVLPLTIILSNDEKIRIKNNDFAPNFVNFEGKKTKLNVKIHPALALSKDNIFSEAVNENNVEKMLAGEITPATIASEISSEGSYTENKYNYSNDTFGSKRQTQSSVSNFMNLLSSTKGKSPSVFDMEKYIDGIDAIADRFPTKKDANELAFGILDAWRKHFITTSEFKNLNITKAEFFDLTKIARKRDLEGYKEEAKRIGKVISNSNYRNLLADAKVRKLRSISIFKNNIKNNIPFYSSLALLTKIRPELLFKNEEELKEFVELLKQKPKTMPVKEFAERSKTLYRKYLEIRKNAHEEESKDIEDYDQEIDAQQEKNLFEEIQVSRMQERVSYLKGLVKKEVELTAPVKFLLEVETEDFSKAELQQYINFLQRVAANGFVDKDIMEYALKSNAKNFNERAVQEKDETFFKILKKKTSQFFLLQELGALKGSRGLGFLGKLNLEDFVDMMSSASDNSYKNFFSQQILNPLRKAEEVTMKNLIKAYKKIDKSNISEEEMAEIGIFAILQQNPTFEITDGMLKQGGVLVESGLDIEGVKTGIEVSASTIEPKLAAIYEFLKNRYFEYYRRSIKLSLLDFSQDQEIKHQEEIQKMLDYSGKTREEINKVREYILKKNNVSSIDELFNKDIALTSRQKEFYDTMQELFFETKVGVYSNGQTLKDVSENISGEKFKEIENYFPLFRYATSVETEFDENLDIKSGESAAGGEIYINPFMEVNINNSFVKGRVPKISALNLNAFEVLTKRLEQQIFYLNNEFERKRLQYILGTDFFKDSTWENGMDVHTGNEIKRAIANYFNRGNYEARVALRRNKLFGTLDRWIGNLKSIQTTALRKAPAQLSSIINSLSVMSEGTSVQKVEDLNYGLKEYYAGEKKEELEAFIMEHAPEIYFRNFNDYEFNNKSMFDMFANIDSEASFIEKVKKAFGNSEYAKELQSVALKKFDRDAAIISFIALYKNAMRRKGTNVDYKKVDREALYDALRGTRRSQSSGSQLSKSFISQGIEFSSKYSMFGKGKSDIGEFALQSMLSFKSFSINDANTLSKIRYDAIKKGEQTGDYSDLKKYFQALTYSTTSSIVFDYAKEVMFYPISYAVSMFAGTGDEDNEKYKFNNANINKSSILNNAYSTGINKTSTLPLIPDMIDIGLKLGETAIRGRELTEDESYKYFRAKRDFDVTNSLFLFDQTKKATKEITEVSNGGFDATEAAMTIYELISIAYPEKGFFIGYPDIKEIEKEFKNQFKKQNFDTNIKEKVNE